MNKKILFKVLAAMMLLVAFSTVAFATPEDDQNNAGNAQQTPVEPDICQHTNTREEVVAYPTCTATGQIKIICKDCQQVVETKTVDALGHTMLLAEHGAPTCTEDGYELYKCANTGCDHTETKSIPAVGHDWHDIRVYEQDTCTKPGLMLQKCLMCEDYRTVEFDEVVHIWELTATVAPTCTEDGYNSYSCSICGEKSTEVLPALGHAWTAWNIDESPSCEHDGLRSRYCTRECCYNSATMSAVKETEVIPAHGHLIDMNYATIVEATETTDGSITGTCVYCSKTITEVIPATGAPTVEPTVKPTDDPNHGNGSGNSGSGNSSSNRPSTNNSGVTIPATGDNTSTAPIVMVVVAFVGLAVLTATRQKVHG